MNINAVCLCFVVLLGVRAQYFGKQNAVFGRRLNKTDRPTQKREMNASAGNLSAQIPVRERKTYRHLSNRP